MTQAAPLTMNATDDIAFTIIPSNAGFTDQLFQFSTYYKLGLSLGYRYMHSTFRNTRGEDIKQGIFQRKDNKVKSVYAFISPKL